MLLNYLFADLWYEDDDEDHFYSSLEIIADQIEF